MAELAKDPCRVTTGKVRLSYEHLFEKHAAEDGQEPKYGTCVLIPKSDTATVAALKSAIEAAKKAGKDKKWNGKIPLKLKSSLRDGDDPEEKCFGDEAYKDHYFFNCSSHNDNFKVVKKTSAGLVPVEKGSVVSGDYVRICVSAFPYNGKSNGVGFGMNNVLFLEKGVPLGASNDPDSDFADELGGTDFEDDDAI